MDANRQHFRNGAVARRAGAAGLALLVAAALGVACWAAFPPPANPPLPQASAPLTTGCPTFTFIAHPPLPGVGSRINPFVPAPGKLPVRVPTRCLPHNKGLTYDPFPDATGVATTGYIKNPTGANRPVNDSNVFYPIHNFPDGYPDAPGGLYHAGDVIPFPGWPDHDGIPRDWNQSKAYRKYYKDNGGAPPGSDKSWTNWQIHHIFEQQFGGSNDWNNLVPADSTNDTGWHKEYTNWWQHVTPDHI